MRESASCSWNKVLRASLFFAVVRSDGGVGSVSLGLPGSEVSVQALGSSSLCTGVWTGEFGGLKLLCAVSMPLLWCRRYVWRRKTNSRVLVVFSALLRDFAVRLRCTVLLRF